MDRQVDGAETIKWKTSYHERYWCQFQSGFPGRIRLLHPNPREIARMSRERSDQLRESCAGPEARGSPLMSSLLRREPDGAVEGRGAPKGKVRGELRLVPAGHLDIQLVPERRLVPVHILHSTVGQEPWSRGLSHFLHSHSGSARIPATPSAKQLDKSSREVTHRGAVFSVAPTSEAH